MSAHIMQAAALLAALVIFCRVEDVLNRMSSKARFSARLSYWALAVGSAWLALSVSQGYRPPPPVALLCAAAALHAARTSGRGGARWI